MQFKYYADFETTVHTVANPEDYKVNRSLLKFVPFPSLEKFVERLMLGSTMEEAYSEVLVYSVNKG